MRLFALFVAMMFCHVVDDFYLQGILSQMKQKSWWRSHKKYTEMYRYDYVVALLLHAFSWTCMIHVPAVLFMYHLHTGLSALWIYAVVFVSMMLIHAIVDGLKANKHRINLVQDQMIHVTQIIIVLMLYAIPK